MRCNAALIPLADIDHWHSRCTTCSILCRRASPRAVWAIPAVAPWKRSALSSLRTVCSIRSAAH
ncbi:hypothetical protein C731_1164 [Mycolicibacterium hassiacum DSM 44199]|uniref:Uncharacterized protein n=1 Tax=Mycolicibacterium hassiacum (strain DSM 44199 / CIP 105218 / JCM 12690 / 3849) TaxID=1122247 RepID=K5BGI4_MYCHD|nr:hypothetical protein C731_1164 [Mycolicibacterium hassiacum DSM 44199]